MEDIPEIIIKMFKKEATPDDMLKNISIVKQYTGKRLQQAYRIYKQGDTIYQYLITFTKNPKLLAQRHKNINDRNILNNEIKEYIKKQFHREPLKIKEAWLIEEGDDVDKHVHWHVGVRTTKPLKKDRFNYYKEKYGNLDINKSKCDEDLQEVINYMSKTGLPERII